MLSWCYHCLLWPEGWRVTRRPRLIISSWRATEEGKHPPWKGGTPTDPIPVLASHLCSRLLYPLINLELNNRRLDSYWTVNNQYVFLAGCVFLGCRWTTALLLYIYLKILDGHAYIGREFPLKRVLLLTKAQTDRVYVLCVFPCIINQFLGCFHDSVWNFLWSLGSGHHCTESFC